MNRNQTYISTPLNLVDVDLMALDESVVKQIQSYNIQVRKRKTYKVPIIFAAAERWAQLTKMKQIQSLNNNLRRPLITVMRKEVNPSKDRFIWRKGDHNNIQISRALGSIRHNQYPKGQGEKHPVAVNGQPVFEIISLPPPLFLDINYNINIWTDYKEDLNEIEQVLFTSMNSDNISIRTDKGIFQCINVSVSDDSNLEEYSDDIRIIKNTISFMMQGYLVNKNEIKVQRTISRVLIEPEVVAGQGVRNEVDFNKFVNKFINNQKQKSLTAANSNISMKDYFNSVKRFN